MAMHFGFTFAEKIALAFFAYVTVATAVVHGSARETGATLALNTVAFATLVALRRNSRRARWLAGAADLLPALLILVAYRESGLLLTPDPTHRLDNLFIQWDRVVLQSALVRAVLRAGGPWLARYLELAYLLCYPLVPLGVAAIHYGAPRNGGQPTGRRPMDDFWATVLLATLFCYAVYPFFPLTPPRVLFADLPGPSLSADGFLRHWNFWLLDHYSVQACIFPSGHVAAVTAVALSVRKHTARLGGLFLFLAASVALATVYGRYHYAADTVAGALVAIAAYQASKLFR
jgi:membrane-associated phospholipid phosphatase